MNNLGLALIEQERNKNKNFIYSYQRKIDLYQKFLTKHQDCSIEKAQAFISWVNHSDYDYETILSNMCGQR